MASRRSGIRTADMDSRAYEELGALMKEYPDWKKEFPDLYAELNPIRYTKNRVNAPKAANVSIQRKRGDAPVTDYQATFVERKNFRPRSSKRPPPTPRATRQPPMATKTIQMEEFRPKFDEYEGRPADFKKEEMYEPPKVKFETQTGYSMDYHAKEVAPTERRTGPPEQLRRTRPAGKFDDRTTNKETFKTWKQDRQTCFSELPTFTDSILYPDQSRVLNTTTATTFTGKPAPKPEPIRISSPNIRFEGKHDFETVNHGTYKNYPGARPASLIVHKPELIAQARSKFESKSQTAADFGYKSERPPRPCEPLKPTIDLKFDNSRSFSTEQRHQFPGIDVTSAPPVVSYKPDNGDYRPPSQKFETQTKHQLDFQPHDVMASYQPPVKPPATRRDRNLPKFVDATTSKEFFRRWEAQPRRQYGDIHETLQFIRSDVFVPTKEKFNGVSTTSDTYKGVRSDRPDPFIPVESGLNREGKFDFTTSYGTTFDGPKKEKVLSKSQAAKLLADLRKRKNGGSISAPSSNNRIQPVTIQG